MSQVTLLLKSKKKQSKDGKQKFRTFFTDVMIVVKGEEEKGKQRKSLTVKFDKKVDTDKLTRGLLTVDVKDIDMPFKYQIIQKDGKESYPSIYIRNYDNFEERRGESTIDFLTEEDDTEETVIDDEEHEEE